MTKVVHNLILLSIFLLFLCLIARYPSNAIALFTSITHSWISVCQLSFPHLEKEFSNLHLASYSLRNLFKISSCSNF